MGGDGALIQGFAPDLDDIEYSIPVGILAGQNKAVPLTPDSAQDVYYAILDDESGSCVVVTDVVDYV